MTGANSPEGARIAWKRERERLLVLREVPEVGIDGYSLLTFEAGYEAAHAEGRERIEALEGALGGYLKVHDLTAINPSGCQCALCVRARAALGQGAEGPSMLDSTMKRCAYCQRAFPALWSGSYCSVECQRRHRPAKGAAEGREA